jgi:alpha-N-arabinofuranosidase
MCSDPVDPSFVGRRQQHLVGSASARLEFVPSAENEKAGLLVFQNEKHFYYICKSLANGAPVVQLYRSMTENASGPQMELLASNEIGAKAMSKAVLFKVEAHGNTYSFSYAVEKYKWIALRDSLDATFLSTRTAGGFVGCMYALYATSLGKPSGNTAYFDWFESAGNDEVYR